MNFTLDIKKWRCGRNPDPQISRGTTSLGGCPTLMYHEKAQSHNMCCLGQFAVNMGVPLDELEGKAYPRQLKCDSGVAAVDRYVSLFRPLTDRLVKINDNSETSIQDKVNLIREVLHDHGHRLTVINGEAYNVK